MKYRHLPALLLVAVCVPLLFIDLDYFSDFPLLLMCWNLGHILLFGLLTWLALRYWPASYTRTSAFKLQFLLLLALLIGAAVEGLQSMIGRMASLDDIVKNITGVMVGFVVYRWRHDRLNLGLLAVLTVVALLLLIWEAKPILLNSYGHYLSWRDFPLLSDFEDPQQLRRWEGTATRAIVNDPNKEGNHWLKANFSRRDDWSTLNLRDFPRDWSQQQFLSFEVYNPSASSQKLHCKIYDHWHRLHGQLHNDRFNRVFILSPGLNHLLIAINDITHAPTERVLDIRRIEHAGFFMARGGKPVILYFDNLILK